MYSRVPPWKGVRLVGEVWTDTTVQQPQRFHPLLRWTAPQRFGSPSTIGIPSRRNPEPFNNNPGHNPQWDWGLPNGSQQQFEAQPTMDWGLPNGFNWPHKGPTTTKASRARRPKSNKFTRFQLPRILVESTPMHQMQKARAQVLKSFTLKSHHKQLMLIGGEERNNNKEHNKWNFKN